MTVSGSSGRPLGSQWFVAVSLLMWAAIGLETAVHDYLTGQKGRILGNLQHLLRPGPHLPRLRTAPLVASTPATTGPQRIDGWCPSSTASSSSDDSSLRIWPTVALL
ncbi:hypothetical protein [Actinomadura sp. 21ATH]|uniref:hypothetical protein n=1 Tax=Actinomadura sp. 21ATH TaxID=1735444 RepID=UPI0035BFF7E1